jgi:HK97 family phage portal protein
LKLSQKAKQFAIKALGFDEYVKRWITGQDLDSENGYLTPDTAMKYTAVFACIRVLSETFASVPAMEYRRKTTGDREPTRDTAVFDILHNAPNSEMSPFNFKEQCMNALNLGGNSVSVMLRNKYGELVGLYPYQWNQVRITRNLETHKLEYKIGNLGTFSREEIFHVPGMSLDGIIGLSPPDYASSAIKLGLSYESFGNNFYKNGANSSGAFSVPGELSDPAYQRLKKEIKDNWTGLRQTGTPMILEGGMDFKPYTINPADAQLIENKRFQVEDICRIYRVPLHLVQNLVGATNNNIEHQSLEFVMYTMLPWFKRYEENVNMQLITPAERKAGYFIEFNIAGLLRGDAKSRADAYAAGRQWGWLSVNDIRRLENMPTIGTAGDIYLQALNMGEAGKVQQDQFKAMTEAIYKMITEKSVA